MGEAQQAAKQAERDREAASRTNQQARATCTSLEAEVQRLSTALHSSQQGQRYNCLKLFADEIWQAMLPEVQGCLCCTNLEVLANSAM